MCYVINHLKIIFSLDYLHRNKNITIIIVPIHYRLLQQTSEASLINNINRLLFILLYINKNKYNN